MATNRVFRAACLLGIVCVCASGFMVSPSTAAAPEFRMGTAAVVITPPKGTPMAGYFSERGSEGVLDDLYAKAAVLDDGKTRVAIVACDLIGISRPVVTEARRIIAGRTGIPGDNVMISATHTHTGPVIVGNSALDELVGGGSSLSRQYAKDLPGLIARAVEQAAGGLTPVRLSIASGTESGMSYIRRFWMKDGTVGWNPGKLNPNIIRPIGTIDPQVNVVYAETPATSPAGRDDMASDGSHRNESTGSRPVLTYVNFALHLDTTGGLLVSADFPATLARLLGEYKGPGMTTMFGNGTCGNINHLNVNWAAGQTSPAEARRLGTILAAAVLRAYMDLKNVDDLTLRARRQVVELPLAKYSDEELRQARAVAARNYADAPLLEAAKTYRILDTAAQQGKPIPVDVQVFTLGRDVAWVALPGEVFVELGLSIKAASPYRQTNVIELSNSIDYYIPNRSAYAEGQYEVVSSPFAEGAGEMLVTTASRLLSELYREAGGNRQ
jgi:neutral ceramidase